jgi:CHAD domain-containing protein
VKSTGVPPELHGEIRGVCADFDADWGHAESVAAHADRLFGETAHLHGLTKTVRPWVCAAALLHDVTARRGREDHHLRGARVIGRLRLPGIAAAGRRVLAEAVRVHGRRADIRPMVEALAARPGDTELQIAGRVAALLRVADGLDHARTGARRILSVADGGADVTVFVDAGRGGTDDAAWAVAKADLWNRILRRPLRVAAVAQNAVPESRMIRPADPLAVAVRRIFQRQAEQLASREYGIAYDRDPEYVHEMRVATRRLRSALRILGKGAGRRRDAWKGELRWIADALGTVRDADVFLAFLRDYAAAAPRGERPFAERLTRSEQRARRRPFRALPGIFASERYRQFRDAFLATVSRNVGAPGGIHPLGRRAALPVWFQAPTALRRGLKTLKDFGLRLDRLTPERRHDLRIACKRVRYTAEFFAEVYPGNLSGLIKLARDMQDGLGDAHDTHVWQERVRRKRGTRAGTRAADSDGLVRHLAEREAASLRRAQRVWRRFHQSDFQKQLRKVIASPAAPWE